MVQFLSIIQLITACLLILVVLLQQKGSGMGAAFGGSSNIYSTKRGIDKVLFKATIVVSIIFFGASLLRVIM
jgi:preprotein translocase subunit SecG